MRRCTNNSRFLRFLTWGLLVGITSTGFAYADGKPFVTRTTARQRYMQAASEAVLRPFAMQAQNGLVLDQTLWNYHFKEGTDQLHKSGRLLLDRLARRQTRAVLELYLQNTYDLEEVESGKAKEFMAARADLNAKRIRAITNYLAAGWPHVSAVVHIHDPNEVGMSAVEAVISLQQVRNPGGIRGYLTSDVLGGISITPGRLGGGGTGGLPSSPPTTEGLGSPSALGTQVPSSPESPQ